MPTGDWPSRVPATQDCLAMGAIPVFFHPTQLAIWPDAAGCWLRDAVVFIDQKQVQADNGTSVLAALRAVGASEWRMQRPGRASTWQAEASRRDPREPWPAQPPVGPA